MAFYVDHSVIIYATLTLENHIFLYFKLEKNNNTKIGLNSLKSDKIARFRKKKRI